MAVRLDQNTCHNATWVPHAAALGPSAAWGTQVAKFSVKQRKFQICMQICMLIGIAIMFGPAGARVAPAVSVSKYLPATCLPARSDELQGRPRSRPPATIIMESVSVGAWEAPTDTLYLISVAGGRVRGRPWSSSVLAGKAHTWQTLPF